MTKRNRDTIIPKTSIKIIDQQLWKKMKQEAKENHETISQYIFRVLKYMKEWEEYQQNTQTFAEVIKEFPIKVKSV